MKTKKSRFFSILMVIGMFIPVLSFSQVQQEIDIQVSPNVLNLQNQGTVVTIHTDISYSLVIGSSVSLNGIVIKSWKSDDRGDFVVKFNMEEVKGLTLNIGFYNTLTLTGNTLEGGIFSGTTEILVINNISKIKR